MKQSIDHKGANKGRPYSDDELVELEYSGTSFSEEEQKELDSDWSSTSDQFHHDDFQSVIDAHDFTFINFYADWCPHCRAFGPTWNAFEDRVNKGEEKMLDADNAEANVKALKVNCVDFEQACQEQKVQAFPSIRLYRRGAKDKQW